MTAPDTRIVMVSERKVRHFSPPSCPVTLAHRKETRAQVALRARSDRQTGPIRRRRKIPIVPPKRRFE